MSAENGSVTSFSCKDKGTLDLLHCLSKSVNQAGSGLGREKKGRPTYVGRELKLTILGKV